jgi:hypothetical protein
MRATAENLGAVKAVMSRIAGRFGGNFPLEPDYHAEISGVLLRECQSLAVLGGVASELYQFDRLPFAREIEALARKNAPGKTGKFWDRCERGCDEGWKPAFSRIINGEEYSFRPPCECRVAWRRDAAE